MMRRAPTTMVRAPQRCWKRRGFCPHKYPATLVYAVLTGEEQGLYGGTVLAHYAASHHWNVEADLNNDIIGNSHGGDGTVDANHVRVFSEGTAIWKATPRREAYATMAARSTAPRAIWRASWRCWRPAICTDFSPRLVYRTDR